MSSFVSSLLPPATTLRQGNVFTPVCHSVHRGDLPHLPPSRHPPSWADTPLRSACWDTVNKLVVRILLEYIFIYLRFNLTLSTSSSGSSSQVGGPRNMKSMQPNLASIFFMTYFYRAGGEGGHGPLGPPWIRY